MEIDEWVSELVYMWTHGWKTGYLKTSYRGKWEKHPSSWSIYEGKFTDKKKLEELLDFVYNIITSVSKENKIRLTMLSHVLVFYAYDLKQYGKVIPSLYTKRFFEIYDDWEL